MYTGEACTVGYTSGVYTGRHIQGVYPRVYPGRHIQGCIPRVYAGRHIQECILQVYTGRYIQGVTPEGGHPEVPFERRPETPLFPFHCWPVLRLLCLFPVSLLASSQAPFSLPVSLLASSQTPFPPLFPFHCWARYPASWYMLGICLPPTTGYMPSLPRL